jgi:putative flippase GtrA
VVGVISTIVNYMVNFLFIYYDFSAYLASAAGYISGVFVGFPLNKLWAFKVEKKFDMHDFLKYLGLYAVTLGVNIFLSGASYRVFGEIFSDPLLIKVVYYFPVIVITTILNFIGCKWMVFKKVNLPV